MKLNQLLTFFAPKDKKFHLLFAKSGANLLETAKTLRELFNTKEAGKRSELIRKINTLEHIGDSITHEIFTELSANFITPFDREDIHYLASSLDDVVDYIHASAQRLELTQIDKITESMKDISEVIEASATEVHKAILELRNVKFDRIHDILVRIHSLENQADDIYDQAISDLFARETNAITLIKYQQMMDNLEIATDKCEDVANAIESIVIKNS